MPILLTAHFATIIKIASIFQLSCLILGAVDSVLNGFAAVALRYGTFQTTS
jgi:hypothetical protein